MTESLGVCESIKDVERPNSRDGTQRQIQVSRMKATLFPLALNELLGCVRFIRFLFRHNLPFE